MITMYFTPPAENDLELSTFAGVNNILCEYASERHGVATSEVHQEISRCVIQSECAEGVGRR